MHADDGGDVHDATGTLVQHFLPDVLRHQESTTQVLLDHEVEVLCTHAKHQIIAGDACVVDEHVDATEALERTLYEALDGLLIGYIRLDGEGIDTFRLAECNRFPGGGSIARVIHENVIAMARKLHRDSTADSPACTGDDGCTCDLFCRF